MPLQVGKAPPDHYMWSYICRTQPLLGINTSVLTSTAVKQASGQQRKLPPTKSVDIRLGDSKEALQPSAAGQDYKQFQTNPHNKTSEADPQQ